jgi:hypothetical protein
MLYKKQILILVSILLSLVTETIAQQSYHDISPSEKAVIFTESFDSNSNNWFLDNLWINGNIANGNYDITCKNYKKSTGLSYKTVFIDQSKDYEIETALKNISGSGGLAFGINSKFDHFRIELSSDGKLSVIKNTPSKGKNEEIYSGPVNSGFKTGNFNKITIRKLQNYYYLFLNEDLIGRFTRINPEGDQIGFNVGLNSEISVDYLAVSYLSAKPDAGLTSKNETKPESERAISENSAKTTPAVTIPVSDAKQNTNLSKTSSPPSVRWVSPSGSKTVLESYTARVRANIKSDSELRSVLFYVNGSSMGEGEIKPSSDKTGEYVAEKVINLNPGENNVYLIATNADGANKSDLRYFSNPPANPPVISWGNPVTENVIVNADRITVEACIVSSTELRSAKILVNGSAQEESNIFQATPNDKCNYKWQRSVILKEGDNSIYIIATNIAGSTTSEKRVVKFMAAVAEKRIALVFGNAEYGEKSSLKNPVNDANLMEATLKELGFEVIKRTNAGLNVMREAVREFSRKLSQYNVALFYYAGHGMQIEGVNYLIPTDAVLKDPSDCKYEAIPVDFVTEEFGKYPENTNIVILDACRNNPYRSWVRGGESGFKAISPTSGTIISFATAAGATAIDGSSANGLFTEELAKQMVIPQAVESVFKKTRVEVRKRSNEQQIPMEWTNLNGEFYFKK